MDLRVPGDRSAERDLTVSMAARALRVAMVPTAFLEMPRMVATVDEEETARQGEPAAVVATALGELAAATAKMLADPWSVLSVEATLADGAARAEMVEPEEMVDLEVSAEMADVVGTVVTQSLVTGAMAAAEVTAGTVALVAPAEAAEMAATAVKVGLGSDSSLIR